jgi:hypothetical protein
MSGRAYPLALVFVLAVACGDDLPSDDASTTGSTGMPAPTTSTSGTPPADSDETAAVDSSGGPAPVEVLSATFDLEIRRDISLVVTQIGDAYEMTVEANEGYGVLVAGQALSGPGRIDALPEAGAILYTARIAGPVVPDGRCGDAPVSLALALHHDQDATFVAGGLTAYCGADTWFGVPVIEPLRISGHLR